MLYTEYKMELSIIKYALFQTFQMKLTNNLSNGSIYIYIYIYINIYIYIYIYIQTNIYKTCWYAAAPFQYEYPNMHLLPSKRSCTCKAISAQITKQKTTHANIRTEKQWHRNTHTNRQCIFLMRKQTRAPKSLHVISLLTYEP